MLRRLARCLILGATLWLASCADLASNSQPKSSDPSPLTVTKPSVTRAVTQSQTGGGDDIDDVSTVVDGGNQFACELYQQLRNKTGNMFYSPASISLALAMTYAGAAGDTETEMANTLHFELPKSQLDAALAALQASWHTTDKKQGFQLNVANRLWGQESYHFLPEFLDVTRIQYGAELARVDFAQDTENVRQTINAWVEDQTEDKIANLIPSADVLRKARLVLTNAVYFQGDWSAPFHADHTQEEDFHVSVSQTVRVPLMLQEGKFRYAAADGVQVLELPYGDGSLSMVVLLPETIDGLSDLEAKLTSDALRTWSETVSSQKVIVYLPKFTTTCEFGLKDALQSLGMASAFDESTADFSGMTGERHLYISAVLHKAFVDVDEAGTEAAAATAVVMVPASLEAQPKQPPVFRADHPFVFFIRDNDNRAILFLGRMVDPTN